MYSDICQYQHAHLFEQTHACHLDSTIAVNAISSGTLYLLHLEFIIDKYGNILSNA